MKLEKAISGVFGCLLSFMLSFAGAACMVTAFNMAVDLKTVALWCFAAAAVSSLCYTLPLGLLPISAAALAGGFLWREGSLQTSFESLLYRLSRQYNKAYGWGIVKLNILTADDMEPTLWIFICFLAAVTAIAVAWAVCRRKSSLPGVLLVLLPVAACFVVTDTVPDTPWLIMLLFALMLLLLTQAVRQQDEAQGNRLSAILALPLAVGLLVLFAIFPQDSYNGQALAQKIADSVMDSAPVKAVMEYFLGDGSGIAPGSNSSDLTNVGPRLETKSEMLQVTADYTGTLYLRGRSMDIYDGKAWYDSGADMERLYWPTGDHKLKIVGEVRISTRYAHRMLYLPYYVRSLSQTNIISGIENTKKLTDYSFSCSIPKDIRSYTGGGSDYVLDGMDDEYIGITEGVKDWAIPLVEKIPGATFGSVYARAQAIAAYVQSSATYDTDTARMPARETDFARWFLEDSDTGYCIHFATATTVLLQAAGIPARYVTGYLVQVESGVTTVARMENSHAWTEYWLPGFGWTVLEATPPDLTQPEETTVTTQTLPQEQTTATQPTVSTDAPQKSDEADGQSLQILLWAAAVLALTAAVFLQRWLRLKYRRQARAKGTENQQALACWQEVTYLARLLGEEPDKALFSLAQKAKFSAHTLTGAELAQFFSYIADAHKKLNKRSLFHRFYYRVILALY